MLFDDPLTYVYLIPVILLSLSFHEFSHAYVAYRLGDPTAKNMGRLTMNPLKHLDILGTIMMVVSRFGWAKPVPINPMYFRDRKKGIMLVSLAGPLSNILLALIFYFPMEYISSRYYYGLFRASSIPLVLYNISLMFYVININLAVFNIIPVPPLDGSKILSGILPSRYFYSLLKYENYISILFLLLVFMFPGLLARIMSPFIWVVRTAIESFANPLLNLLP